MKPKQIFQSLILFLFLISGLLVFSPTTEAEENFCDLYTEDLSSGNYISYQGHDYVNGFLSLHLKFEAGATHHNLGLQNKLYRRDDCHEASSYGQWWYMGYPEIPMDVTYFSIRFYGPIVVGTYTYKIYDDITNQPLNCRGCDNQFQDWIYFGHHAPHKIRILAFMYDPARIAYPELFVNEYNLLRAIDIQEPPKPEKTPVLIVPGVLGSEMWKGDEELWANIKMANPLNSDDFMDPLGFNANLSPSDSEVETKGIIRKITRSIGGADVDFFDYSGSLLQQFASENYIENQNVFTFPYDWRYGVNNVNINALKTKINQILAQTGASSVDVVAHSTGGLLVKKYVQNNLNAHKIRKAVMVGVPHLGSPKAVKVLTQGDNFGVVGLSDAEMKKIATNLPVVYDLSPSQKYFETNGSFVKVIEQKFLSKDEVKDLNYSETANYLLNEHEFNTQAYLNSQDLHTADFDNFDMKANGVDTYEITGCKAGTIGQVVEKRTKDIFGNTLYAYEQPKYISGDQTVPFESSDAGKADDSKKYYVPKANHGTMLSANGTRQLIVNLLTESSLNTGGKILTKQDLLLSPNKCALKGKVIKIQSPLDIEVFDNLGNHLGFFEDHSLENTIPGADFSVFGEHKYVYLPEDEGQEYEIKLKGSGQGVFTLGVTDIEDSLLGKAQNFVHIPVSEITNGELDLKNNQAVLDLDQDGNGVFEEVLEPNAVLDQAQALDYIAPETTHGIAGTAGNASWYLSDVSINLTATDNLSGVLKTMYSVNGGELKEYLGPIVLDQEGQFTIEYFSIDKAGNYELKKSVEINIDKTLPEISVEFNVLSGEFAFNSLEQDSSLICSMGECVNTDIAGNVVRLTYNKLNVLGGKHLILNSLFYNNLPKVLKKNLFSVVFGKVKEQIKVFNQMELINNQQVMNISFSPKTNKSSIIQLLFNNGLQKTEEVSIKLLQVYTDKGILKTSIK